MSLPTERPETRTLLKEICGMSEGDFKRYFLMMNFQGKSVSPPRMVPTPGAVRAFVRNTPGALGVIRARDVDSSVTVMSIDGIGPGAPGYKLAMQLSNKVQNEHQTRKHHHEDLAEHRNFRAGFRCFRSSRADPGIGWRTDFADDLGSSVPRRLNKVQKADAAFPSRCLRISAKLWSFRTNPSWSRPAKKVLKPPRDLKAVAAIKGLSKQRSEEAKSLAVISRAVSRRSAKDLWNGAREPSQSDARDAAGDAALGG